jgi:hypothetical protein
MKHHPEWRPSEFGSKTDPFIPPFSQERRPLEMPVTTEVRAKSGQLKKVALTPLAAIRHHCRECCGWDREVTKDSGDPLCALYAFSLNEAAKKNSKFDEEELERRRESARKAWAKGGSTDKRPARRQ